MSELRILKEQYIEIGRKLKPLLDKIVYEPHENGFFKDGLTEEEREYKEFLLNEENKIANDGIEIIKNKNKDFDFTNKQCMFRYGIITDLNEDSLYIVDDEGIINPV